MDNREYVLMIWSMLTLVFYGYGYNQLADLHTGIDKIIIVIIGIIGILYFLINHIYYYREMDENGKKN